MAEAGRKLGLAAGAWLLIAGLALFELVAHPLLSAAVPGEGSWEAASAFVRAHYQPSDRIVAAPAWVDPVVRSQLGDLVSLRAAAPPDAAGIDRLWEVSIRGASSEAASQDEPPALVKNFDGVRVRMWTLPGDELVYDFVEEAKQANVELVGADGSKRCPLLNARPAPGGLGQGPMTPSERFVCDPGRPWLWVGATVLSDLELQARRCIWQHPAGREPIRVTFANAALGDRLLVHGGSDYETERWGEHAPVTLRVWVDARLVGELVHKGGEGWSGLEIDTSELGSDHANVRFETTADDPNVRRFCWSASATRRRSPAGAAKPRLSGGDNE